ncbi:MAG: hypothetical protein ACYSWW_23705 [Planctomycetota bacterium]
MSTTTNRKKCLIIVAAFLCSAGSPSLKACGPGTAIDDQDCQL